MSATTISHRPMGKLDAQGNCIPNSFTDLSFRGDYTSTNLIYKGLARPGASTAQPVWQVAKLAYDGSNNLTSILWPKTSNGNVSSDFIFTWDDRASYTYS